MIPQNHQLFGAFPGSMDPVVAAQGESLAAATHRRKTKGPYTGGRYGFTAVPSGTFTGSMTVWYSHLPNPDPAVEAHWFQDTDIGTITLVSGTTQGRMVGNARATNIRFVVTVATGTMLLSLWVDSGH